MSGADDLLALRRLAETYALGCDRRDLALLESVFADGAVFTIHRDVESTMVAPGDLQRIPTGLARYDVTFHVIGNHHAVVDGDDATCATYCMAHHLVGDQDFVMAIRYDDRCTRTADGWRVVQRDLWLLWTETRTVAPTGNT